MTPDLPPPLPPPLPSLPPPVARPGFRVGFVSLAVYLLAASALGYLDLPRQPGQDNAFRVGLFMGGALAMFLLPLVLSLLAWLAAGRRQAVATAVFCSMVLLVLAGQVAQAYHQHQSEMALARIDAARSQLMKEQQQRVQSGDTLKGSTDRLDRYQKQLAQAGENVGGAEQQIIQAGQTMLARLKVPMQAYESTYGQFLAAGGIKPNTLTSAEDIAARRRMVSTCADANARLTQVIGGMEGDFRAELQRRGIRAATIDNATAGYIQSSHPDLLLQVRGNDRQILDAADGLLETLGRTWGHWRINPAGKVSFENTADAARYNGFFHALNDAAAAEKSAQEQFIAAQAANQPLIKAP